MQKFAKNWRINKIVLLIDNGTETDWIRYNKCVNERSKILKWLNVIQKETIMWKWTDRGYFTHTHTHTQVYTYLFQPLDILIHFKFSHHFPKSCPCCAKLIDLTINFSYGSKNWWIYNFIVVLRMFIRKDKYHNAWLILKECIGLCCIHSVSDGGYA